MIKTLKQLAVIYKKAPVMLSAINTAIELHTDTTRAIVVSGQPSVRKNSNIYKQCGNQVLDIIPGAKRRYQSEGYHNIVILRD